MSIQVISPETDVAKTTEVSPDQTVVSNPSVSKKVSAQVASTQAPVKANAAAALAKKDQEEEARQAQIAEAADQAAETVAEKQVAEAGETVEATQTIATVAEEIDASSETLAGVVADAPMMFAQAGAAAAGGAAAGGISTAAIVAGVAVVGVAAAASSSSDSPAPSTLAGGGGNDTVAVIPTGLSYTLTATAQSITAESGKANTIDGSLLDSISGDTIVDGTAGDNDTLNYTANGAVDPVMVANIENINATGKYGALTVNGSKFTGAKVITVASETATGAATVSNAKASAVELIKAGTNIATLTVTTAAAGTEAAGISVDAGSATALVLTGTATKADIINLTSTGGARTITATTMADTTDVLNITTTTADATLTFSGTGAGPKTIVLKGGKNVVVKGDADVFTANTITDSISGGTTTLEITAMTTASANLSKAAVDLIHLKALTTGVTLANAANVKLATTSAGALVADTGATTVNVDLAEATTGALTNTGFTSINFTANTKAVTSLDARLTTASTTLNLSGSKDVTLAATYTAKDVVATSLTGKLTATAVGEAGRVNITGGSGNDAFTVGTVAAATTINGGAGDDTIRIGTLADFKLTIDGGTGGTDKLISTASTNFNQTDAKTSVIAGIEEMSIAASQTLTLTQAQVFTNGNAFKVSGTGTLALVDDTTSSAIFDLANLTFTPGDNTLITITGRSAAANTITGTATADTIVGGSAADVINAGAGNDVITGLAGKDTINVGTGTDTIVYTVAAQTGTIAGLAAGAAITGTIDVTSMDVITGMGTGDVLRFSNGTDFALYVTAAGTATATAFLNAASTSLAVQNGMSLIRGDLSGNSFVTSVTGADTLVVVDAAAATNAVSFEALVLTGYTGGGVTIATFPTDAGFTAVLA